MRPLHTSVVRDDETDDLGHMNVRFYVRRAAQGNVALAAALGLGGEALDLDARRAIEIPPAVHESPAGIYAPEFA